MPTPEQLARQDIDRLLEASGWAVQDRDQLNLSVSPGVAVREFQVDAGAADYLLFVAGKAAGVVEAKPAGTTLSGVAEQSGKYTVGLPAFMQAWGTPLPFAYESTGVETLFRDNRDPDARSRRVYTFHRPETLLEWAQQPETFRARLRNLPELTTAGLRTCQVEAVSGLDRSFALGHPRALIQMATGSGKTYAAITAVYRLIKYGRAKRVLFLVDRNNLGKQALREFQQYVPPDSPHKFAELYNVQHLTSNAFDPVAKVCISTIQRVYSMLRGEETLDAGNEERSLFDTNPREEQPREIAYNPALPIETFDVIITDECHRSIYNLWRQVLEYFDAFLIGLTATPSKQTLGFFNQNLVTEYSHERAVADGVNVGYEIYRIRTRLTDQGGHVDAGYYVDKRDRHTRQVRWQQLDDDLDYGPTQLDNDVVALDQIRTVIETFRDRLFIDLFPERTEVPKTLVFAKSDAHAEDIVHIVREVFGKGNEFCRKITYMTQGDTPENLIQAFRNSYHPRIAVTVDMVSTGTDIRPIECLLFMRDVKSRVYYEQMLGRGTRTISDTDLAGVTPGAVRKTHFVVVDAVGVSERAKVETRTLERKRTVSFDKLLEQVALGDRSEDTLSSLAGRLARLDQTLSPDQRREVGTASGGVPLRELVHSLLDAIDPDAQLEHAQQAFDTSEPTTAQLAQTAQQLADQACAPFNAPALRQTLTAIHSLNEQTIDTVSDDEVIEAGYGAQARQQAEDTVHRFRDFIEANKDELTALQLLYSRPYGQRQLTYESVRELADALERPPNGLTTDRLWRAYETLDRSKVRGAGPAKLLTNIISLVRYAIGEADALEPFPLTVEQRFEQWLAQQDRQFTEQQLAWLLMMRDHIAASANITLDDFKLAPFADHGGAMRVYQLFGEELEAIVTQMNEVLAA
mgnify:CR=1 FL=1